MKQIIAILAVLLMLVIGVFLVISITKDDSDSNNSPIQESTQESVYKDTISIADDNVSESTESAQNIEASEITTESTDEVTFEDIDETTAPYDYSLPVPTCEAVTNEYFDNCVFIGDSRMLGLLSYTDINPTNYCGTGFSLASYDKLDFVRIDGETYTVKDALRTKDGYTAVYIATGLNELGWNKSSFISSYAGVIDDIKEAAPDCPIYLQLILPITSEFESSKSMNPFGLKNSDVVLFNESLIELAKEKEIYYLDCSELFVLEDGYLNPEKSYDGAHLAFDCYNEQLEYYKTHVVI